MSVPPTPPPLGPRPLDRQRIEAWRQGLISARGPRIQQSQGPVAPDAPPPKSVMLAARPQQPELPAPWRKGRAPLLRTVRAICALATAGPKLVLTPIVYGATLALTGLIAGCALGLAHGFEAVRDNALPGPLKGWLDGWGERFVAHELRSENSDVPTLLLD